MGKIAKYGLLDGLGKGVSQHGNTLRDEWIKASDRQAESKESDRQRGMAKTDANELEETRHKNRMSEHDNQSQNRIDEGRPDVNWRQDGYSYRTVGGVTEMLEPGSSQWQRVSEAGEAGGSGSDEENYLADEYATQRVNETAGWLSSDKTDFAEFDGSSTKAHEHYRQEFLHNRRNGGAPAPNSGATRSVSLDTPDSPTATPDPAQAATESSAASNQAETRPTIQELGDSARSAIQSGRPREAIIQRLLDNGYPQAEIDQLGL